MENNNDNANKPKSVQDYIQSVRADDSIFKYLRALSSYYTKLIHITSYIFTVVYNCRIVSFIPTLKRFFTNRDKSSTIMADNGTIFVGTNTELKEFHAMTCKPGYALAEYSAFDAVTWKFLTVPSPNFVALWGTGLKHINTTLKEY